MSFILVSMRMPTCMHTFTIKHYRICKYICIYVCVCVSTCVCVRMLRTYVGMSVCLSVCVCVGVDVVFPDVVTLWA